MKTLRTVSESDKRPNWLTNVALLAFTTLIVLAFSVSGFAGLSVTPLLLDLTMSPGSSHTGKLSLQNTGSRPVHVESQVRGFRTSDKGVAHFLSKEAAEEYPYSGEKLLTIDPVEIVLEPGETHDFTYEIKFPEVPDPFGGRYVGALFKATPVEEKVEETAGSSIKVATRVGTLILIRPNEEVLVDGKFKEFVVKPKIESFSTKIIYEGTRLLISTLLNNAGNIHIRKTDFSGSIVISEEGGDVIDEIEISPHNVLPATSYALNELWSIPAEIKEGEAKAYRVSVVIDVLTPYGQTVKVQRSLKAEM